MWRKRDYRKCESRFCDGKQRIEELEAENAALKNVGVTRHADDATLAYIAQLERENAAQKRRKQMAAEDTQVGGNHYASKKVQPWHAMEAWMTRDQFAGFLRGNAIKYLARCDDKGGLEDLKKARHYLDKLIEFHECSNASLSGLPRKEG